MSRALRCWQISRNCLALLRSATDGPLRESLPALVPAPAPERLWLPAWPEAAVHHGRANSYSHRGFASGPAGGSGNGYPPPDQTPRSSNAASAEQPQPSQQQSGSASGLSSTGSAQTGDAADGDASPPLEAAASGVRSSSGANGLPGSDGLRGDMTSVVVPSEQLEYEADALLDAWEPLMAQVWGLPQCIVCCAMLLFAVGVARSDDQRDFGSCRACTLVASELRTTSTSSPMQAGCRPAWC